MSDHRLRKGSANWQRFDPAAFAVLAAHLRRSKRPTLVLLARLVLRTGLREGEIRFAEWSDIDFQERSWIIPPQNAKGQREIRVPLSDSSIRVLRALQRQAGSDERVAPGGAPKLYAELRRATLWIGSSGASMAALREEGMRRFVQEAGLRGACETFGYAPTGNLPRLLLEERKRSSRRGKKAAIGAGATDAVNRQDQRRSQPERLRGQGLPPLSGRA